MFETKSIPNPDMERKKEKKKKKKEREREMSLTSFCRVRICSYTFVILLLCKSTQLREKVKKRKKERKKAVGLAFTECAPISETPINQRLNLVFSPNSGVCYGVLHVLVIHTYLFTPCVTCEIVCDRKLATMPPEKPKSGCRTMLPMHGKSAVVIFLG